LSIFDASDYRLDSAVFLDNLQFYYAPTAAACDKAATPVGSSLGAAVLDFRWSPDEPCIQQFITFEDLSIPNSGAAWATIMWDFGDGVTVGPMAYTPTSFHFYGAPGPYTVTVTLVDSASWSGSVAKTLFVDSMGSWCTP
jgi:PKD repeat protein